MERFSGQPLRERPHIAVLFYDAIGDFVVATPLLRGVRDKYPGCTLDYLGGERTRQLEEASRLVDSRFSVFGAGTLTDLPGYLTERRALAGDFDLAVNCDDHPVAAVVAALLAPRYVVGRCFDGELRSPLPDSGERLDELWRQDWADADLLGRYGDLLQTQFIGEILCRLARVETDYARTEAPVAEPPLAVPPILIATGGKRSAKLWPAEHWLALLRHCQRRGLAVGLLGDAPAQQRSRYHSADLEDYLLGNSALQDLRGALSLPQVAGALQRARACVTVDNGIMHLAGAVGTPTLALFGASPWRVWAPPVPHLQVLLGDEPCPLCAENRFRNEACLRERHVCLESLAPSLVAERLDGLLSAQEAPARQRLPY
ncbi:MAG: glycosyltransferase family 9 protein [Chloroflexi bacterium]|nr:glycosyltransferase family 9 protein [Chloroflexota bacterium]MCL5107939.1 glycosyltransferase family 9 protein [Chloroflexota bacterium]